MAETVGKTDAAWAQILGKHQDIVRRCKQGEVYELEADEIKGFREPRLMTKFA